MAVQLPTMEQLRAVARECGLSLDDADLSSFRALLEDPIRDYNDVAAMTDELPPVRHPRTPGYRPRPEDNKHNAWYRKTSVKGSGNGKLQGKRVVLKDNIMLADVPMMNGASTLEGYVPEFDATVVTRILDAGGEIVGKANCEFLCISGGSHTNATGPVHNDPYFTTARGTKILHEYPDGNALSTAQRAWIKSYFDDFEAALISPGADLSTFIDVGSFIDYFIVNEVMKNIDAYRISTYKHKDRGSTLVMGPVWDFDLSSTTVARYGGARPDGWVIFQDFGADAWKPPFWWRRLLANEGFVEQLIRRWRLLRNGALRLSSLFHVIDEWSALLDEAQARNYERWPVALTVPIGDEPIAFPTYAGEVDEFRSFLEARLSWIDANINWLRPAGPVAPDEAGGPAVTASGSHVLDVFVRGKHNHELVHRYYNGIQWSGWINLGGDLA